MESFDIAIIGTGIAGTSLAYGLADRRSAVVLERESHAGYHSAGRSAAMFMESYGPPGVRALTRASREFYEAPPPWFTEVSLLKPRGALYVAMHGQEAELEGTYAELIATCPGLRPLDAQFTLALAPCLRPQLLQGTMLDGES